MRKRCPTKVVRVTTHRWGPPRRKVRRDDGTPYVERVCLDCGKTKRTYGDRGY